MTAAAPAVDAVHAVAPPDVRTLHDPQAAAERIRPAFPAGPVATSVFKGPCA